MTDRMHYGSFIPESFVTAWVREINEFEMQYKDTLFARNYLPNRDVGANIDFDTVQYYDTQDRKAQMIAKGSIPEPFTVRGRSATHEMYQFAEAFVINERDLKKPDGAAMKTKELDVAVRNIHKAEDYYAINGDGVSLLGIVNAARANSNGKVANTGGTYNNMGAWDGTDTSRDPYEDINLAITLQEEMFKPMYLLGSRLSLSYLRTMDSERRPFWKDVAGLFGKGEDDSSFMVESEYCPAGYVYVLPYDPQAMEFVISEELDIDEDYPKQLGGNYHILVNEWVNPVEVHVPSSIVEINIQ